MFPELPFGWEQAYHPDFGVYYIDHNRCKFTGLQYPCDLQNVFTPLGWSIEGVNQIEDPCQLWRKEQERLLAEYVQEARERLLVRVTGG